MGALVTILLSGLMLPFMVLIFILFLPFFIAFLPFAFLAFIVFKAIVG